MMAKRTRFQCKNISCKKYFDTEAKRDSHMKLIHDHDFSAALKVEDPRPFKCDFKDCDHGAPSEKALKRHKTEKDHGGTPAKSTVFRRRALARAASESTNLKDVQGALAKAIQENIRLNAELEKMQKERTIVVQSATPAIAQDVFDDMRKMLDGDPLGATEEEKLGLVACYDLALQANDQLRADLELAKAGLIPEEWLAEIRKDLNASIEMIVTGMREVVKDRGKIVKYDALVQMLNG